MGNACCQPGEGERVLCDEEVQGGSFLYDESDNEHALKQEGVSYLSLPLLHLLTLLQSIHKEDISYHT